MTDRQTQERQMPPNTLQRLIRGW